MEGEWIEIDLGALKNLHDKNIEEATAIEALIPDIPLYSPKGIKRYFEKYYHLELKNARIQTLKQAREWYDHDSECFNDLTGTIEYLTNKYIYKNYIKCFYRHHKNGRVALLEGRLLPNKRPMAKAPEITGIIRRTSWEQ